MLLELLTADVGALGRAVWFTVICASDLWGVTWEADDLWLWKALASTSASFKKALIRAICTAGSLCSNLAWCNLCRSPSCLCTLVMRVAGVTTVPLPALVYTPLFSEILCGTWECLVVAHRWLLDAVSGDLFDRSLLGLEVSLVFSFFPVLVVDVLEIE